MDEYMNECMCKWLNELMCMRVCVLVYLCTCVLVCVLECVRVWVSKNVWIYDISYLSNGQGCGDETWFLIDSRTPIAIKPSAVPSAISSGSHNHLKERERMRKKERERKKESEKERDMVVHDGTRGSWGKMQMGLRGNKWMKVWT